MAKPIPASKRDRANRRKRRRFQATALVFCALALVGVVTIVSVLVRYSISLFDDSAEKEAYAELIAPMVSLDPAPFDSIKQCDPDIVLQSAIWATLNGEDLERYEHTDGGVYLPAVDVERYCTRMFGSEVTLEHRSLNVSGIKIEYSPVNKRYFIPSTSLIDSYMPVVVNITTSGNLKILLVAYTYAGTEVDESGYPLKVEKYMEYLLIKDGNDYYLYAIREPEATDTSIPLVG